MEYKAIIQEMLKNLDSGIILLDDNLKITSFNEASMAITGYDKDKALGKSIYDIFPTFASTTSKFCKSLIGKRPELDYIQNFTNFKGRDTICSVSTIPFLEDNELNGLLLIFKDYTNVKELGEKMLILQGTLYGEKTVDNKFLPNGTQHDINDIISKSEVMEKLKYKIKGLSHSIDPIFIYGETGTGKELVAESIHNNSTRSKKPYITQKCCVMPDKLLENVLFGTYRGSFIGARDKPGLLEITDGGTLFLDDIGAMGMDLQKKLLEVIETGRVSRIGSKQTKKVDIRVIASSNKEPSKLVEEDLLDKDLYHIFKKEYIEVPALRSRKEDIELLVKHFIEESNTILNKHITGLGEGVLDYLTSRTWPGNIRELKNIIEISMNVLDADILELDDIKIDSTKDESRVVTYELELDDIDLKEAVEEYEKHIIKYTLSRSNNNCAEAARKLKVPKQTLHGKLKRYGIID